MNEKYIEERFEQAAKTLIGLRNLTNRDVPQRVKTAWPEIVRSFYEAYGWNAARFTKQQPTAADISQLDEVIEWSMLVPEGDRRILWERAFRVKWKFIQARLDCGRTTAWGDWVTALARVSLMVFGEQKSEHFSSEHSEQNAV